MLFQLLLVGSAAALFIQPLISYLLDTNQLRKFPAPSYAGLSSLWRISQNLNRRHYLAIHEAHQKLGTHIRIAPNHIFIADPQAVPEIYSHGARFLKDAFYDGGAGEHRHMADVRVKTEHQRKRKALAHVFAQKMILDLEPVVMEVVEALVAQIDKHISEGKCINMRRFLNFFTISFFPFTRGDDVVNALSEDGKMYEVPFIKWLHDATVINTVLGMEAPLLAITKKIFKWHPYAKAGADYDNIIRYSNTKRLHKENPSVDIFSKLLKDNKGESLDFPLGELLAECSVMMNAGTDTTTAALTNTIYLLYKNPHILKKLREELDAATGEDIIPSFDQVSNLPYLRACIEESLRIRPASSMGLPHVVPKGGRTIVGHFIQENVTVSVPTYSLLRDANIFEDPETYNPNRWTTDDKEKMSKAHLPFSTGPRACIGRKIAYFEQLLAIATLVKGFDFDFEEEGFELNTLERFNSNPGELVLKSQRRPRVV